jgi:CDP-glucose 4,6-dehydratase
VTAAYRKSFLQAGGVAVASARAGNVIGGGDWAADRLLPDAFRAMDAGLPLDIRSPSAVRPWQHVLEPLSGYLLLAARLHGEGPAHAEAWNFGPADESAQSVSEVLTRLGNLAPDFQWRINPAPQPHEAAVLRLDSARARQLLGWHPRWSLDMALEGSLEWHRAWRRGADMGAFSLAQIESHTPFLHSPGGCP